MTLDYLCQNGKKTKKKPQKKTMWVPVKYPGNLKYLENLVKSSPTMTQHLKYHGTE